MPVMSGLDFIKSFEDMNENGRLLEYNNTEFVLSTV